MKTIETRILDINSLDLIIDFSKSKDKISGTDNSNWEWDQFKKMYEMSFLHSDQNTIIGAFENNELQGYVAQHFSPHAPSWYMSMVLQKYNGWLRTGHGDYINACLIEATRIAESRGVFDVVYTMPAKWIRTTKRTQPTSPIWSRYNVYIEAYIPAGTLPVFDLHKYMHGGPKDHDRIVKKCSLKMEHRLEYFKQKGYDLDASI